MTHDVVGVAAPILVAAYFLAFFGAIGLLVFLQIRGTRTSRAMVVRQAVWELQAGRAEVQLPVACGMSPEQVAWFAEQHRYAVREWLAHLAGSPVTPIPIVGDVAQRSVDAWTADIANQVKDANNEAAAAKVATDSLKSQNQMTFHIGEWADERGIGHNNDGINNLEHDVRGDQNTERENASRLLGR